MHSNVIEKRSFNGFSNNNYLSPHSLYCQHNGQSHVNNQLLTSSQNAHQTLRRSRSASPATSTQRLKLQQQHHLGILLSHDQQMLIRKSWLKITKATFGKSVFDQMIDTFPSAARLFDPPADVSTIPRHQRYFAELVQRAVDTFSQPTPAEGSERPLTMGQWLELVGQGHAQFKVRRAHWDCLGEVLTDAICHWLPPGRQRRETVHAWRVLLSFIADRLGTQMTSVYGQTPGHVHHPRIELLQLVAEGGAYMHQDHQSLAPSNESAK